MKRVRPFSILAGCTLLWASQALHAAPCTQAPSSFDDVAVNDIFCTDVQWLKNRGVTLGCTPATDYCPSEVVTRGSMALFMKRLAEAILPEPMMAMGGISDQTIGLPPPPPGSQFCLVTIPDSANVHPRAFSITGCPSRVRRQGRSPSPFVPRSAGGWESRRFTRSTSKRPPASSRTFPSCSCTSPIRDPVPGPTGWACTRSGPFTYRSRNASCSSRHGASPGCCPPSRPRPLLLGAASGARQGRGPYRRAR
jgi:hypothetical protein